MAAGMNRHCAGTRVGPVSGLIPGRSSFAPRTQPPPREATRLRRVASNSRARSAKGGSTSGSAIMLPGGISALPGLRNWKQTPRSGGPTLASPRPSSKPAGDRARRRPAPAPVRSDRVRPAECRPAPTEMPGGNRAAAFCFIAAGERVIRYFTMTQSDCCATATMATSFLRGTSCVKNQVDLVRHQRQNQFFGRADPDMEANIGMGCLELGDGGRQQFTGDGSGGGHAHLATHQAAKLLDPRSRRLSARKSPDGHRPEMPRRPTSRERHAASARTAALRDPFRGPGFGGSRPMTRR